MINGTIEELWYYLPEKLQKIVMEYVKEIDKNTEDGYTYLLDDKVYGRVMSYDTLPKETCKLEAHNRYVDIQVSISGSEGIEVYQRSQLKGAKGYDTEKDVIFFDLEKEKPYAFIHNIPGRFSMFFPEDVHRPKICVRGSSRHVKKYVIKIEKSLFE